MIATYLKVISFGALIATVIGFQAACNNRAKEAVKPSKPTLETKKSASAEAERAAPVGVVEGVVTLKDGAKLPSFPVELMSRQTLRTKLTEQPKVCSPTSLADQQPVQLTPDGTLVGVLVAGSEFKKPYQRPALVHNVTIEDCRLKPSFVAAQKGDKLIIRNATDYPFMPQFGAAAYMETLIKGQEKEIDLDKGGLVTSILCGFTASCGRADVIVLYDAIYAVTDNKGHFRIENVPAGQEGRLSVWHPLFQETSAKVYLAAGETKTIEIEAAPLEKYTVEESKPKEKPTKGAARGKKKQ
jgi:hypothetical protein